MSYLQKQRESHPDNNGNANDSVNLNIAYSVLNDSLKRAEYILILQGKDINNMPGNLALKMFSMRENFASITDNNERNVFIEQELSHISKLIDSLNDKDESGEDFFQTVCEIKFVNAFLEKVQSDGYSRN